MIALYGLGSLLLEKENNKTSQKYLDEAKKLDPNNLMVLKKEFDAEFNRGLEDAEDSEKVENAMKKDPEKILGLAEKILKQKDLVAEKLEAAKKSARDGAKAIEVQMLMTEWIALEKFFAEVYYKKSLFIKGLEEKAKVFNEAIKLDKENLKYKFAQAELYYEWANDFLRKNDKKKVEEYAHIARKKWKKCFKHKKELTVR